MKKKIHASFNVSDRKLRFKETWGKVDPNNNF